MNIVVDSDIKNLKSSYANMAQDKSKFMENIEKQLEITPTETDENGNEIIIFYEELISVGSLKWKYTLCGYFVGHSMNANELRYNLRRMWNRHGIKDVIESTNGIFCLSFIRK